LIRSKFMSNAIVLLHEQDNIDSGIYKLVLFINNKTIIDGRASAYVCENYVCKQPVNKIDDFDKMLSDITRVK
jgi:uncharacterized protein YyaL (SSP411 family)